MSWEADRVLEGVFMFGGPINIWQMELYQERNGDLGYYRIHMNIDDDEYLLSRLREKMKGEITYYPRLVIMESPRTRSVPAQYWTESFIYKAWLYSLERGYRPTTYPYEPWPGWTLGIAADKTKANIASVSHLFRGGPKLGFLRDKLGRPVTR